MFKFDKLIATTGLALLLAACGSGADQAPVPDPATSADAAMIDPNNPFAAAEMAMNDRMMAAVGADIPDTWVRQMIEHHRGAIAMSEIVLQRQPTAEVREMARETIARQGREVDELTALIRNAPADPTSPEPYKAANMAMHEAMMAAKGSDVSETYLRKMLAHHRGAVALADVVLANGATGGVRTLGRAIKSDQTKEAGMIEAMLAGESMPMAASAAGAAKTATAATPKASPTAARPTARPAPAKPAIPKPSPAPTATASDPHTGHDMKDMPGAKM